MMLSVTLLYASRLMFSRRAYAKGSGESKIGKKSLGGAVLCIAISLVPLVVLLVISNGMIEGITGRLINLSSGHISITLARNSQASSSLEEFSVLANAMAEIEGITAAYLEIQGNALAVGRGCRSGTFVRGVEPDIFGVNENFSALFNIIEGTCYPIAKKSCVIGQKIAELLGLHPGDTLTLITMNSAVKGNVLTPKAASFTVQGIVSSGYQELDALWTFIPVSDAFMALAVASRNFIIALETADAFSPDFFAVHRNVTRFFQNSETEYKASVMRWDEVHADEFENFASTKALLVVIMLLILLVASVNISSALVMLFMERRKEIAILKSIGATPVGITCSFVLTGFFAGLCGLALGLPIGIIVSVNINPIIHAIESCVNFFAWLHSLLSDGAFREFHVLDPAYYLQEIPVEIPVRELLIIVTGTLLLSVTVSLAPSIRAGREKPIETLRKM